MFATLHLWERLTCFTAWTTETTWTDTLVSGASTHRSTSRTIRTWLRGARIACIHKMTVRVKCRMENSRSSHRWPLKPGGHWHVNPPKLLDTQAAPLRHGFGIHASPRRDESSRSADGSASGTSTYSFHIADRCSQVDTRTDIRHFHPRVDTCLHSCTVEKRKGHLHADIRVPTEYRPENLRSSHR